MTIELVYRTLYEGLRQGKNMLCEVNATPNCCHALLCSVLHQRAIRDMSRDSEDLIHVSQMLLLKPTLLVAFLIAKYQQSKIL